VDENGVDKAKAIARMTRVVFSITNNFYQDNDSF
jgi:hypothetical protein